MLVHIVLGLEEFFSFKHCIMLELLSPSLQVIKDSNFGLSLINEEKDMVPLVPGMLFCGYVKLLFNYLG